MRRFLSPLGEGGAAAVEFAFVAPLFFGFIFALFDLALFTMSALLIQGSVVDAGRLVWTGQAQVSGDAPRIFREAVCNHVRLIVSCDAVTFDVRTYPTFSAVQTAITLDGNGNMVSQGMNFGEAEQIVVGRVAYRHHFIMPFFGLLTQGDALESHLIVATGVFKNEPYSS